MNLKKMDQKQVKKILDALANHPEKKSEKKEEVNLNKIAKTLTDRKLAKIKTSSEKKENEKEEETEEE